MAEEGKNPGKLTEAGMKVFTTLSTVCKKAHVSLFSPDPFKSGCELSFHGR